MHQWCIESSPSLSTNGALSPVHHLAGTSVLTLYQRKRLLCTNGALSPVAGTSVLTLYQRKRLLCTNGALSPVHHSAPMVH